MAIKTKSTYRRRAVQVSAYNHTNSAEIARTYVSWTDTKTGQGLRNWKTIIANNGNATTPFSGEYGWMIQQVGSANLAHSHDFSGKTIYNDSVAGDLLLHTLGVRGPDELRTSGVNSLSETQADNEARINLYKRISQQHTKFQGGVALGEFAETVRMLRSPVKAFRDGITAYVNHARRTLNGRSLSRTQKEKFLAKSWLEYSFGWKPLVHDIEDAVEAWHSFMHPEDVPTRLSASGMTSELDLSRTGTGKALSATGSHITVNYYREEQLSVQVRYRCGHLMSRTASYANGSLSGTRLKGLFGFNAESFIPTVWELIPYSFLVDYFTNIGDLLSAYVTDTAGVTWICKTVRRMRTNTSVATGLNMAQIQADIGGSLGHVLGTSFSPSLRQSGFHTITRTPIAALQLPTLQFTYPSGENSWKRWLNMSALTTQRRL